MRPPKERPDQLGTINRDEVRFDPADLQEFITEHKRPELRGIIK